MLTFSGKVRTLMKDIRLTYFDSDIRYSTYFLLFFRMIGIYVHERVIRTEEEVAEKFLYQFDATPDVEVDIFILRSAMDEIWLHQYANSKSIYVIPESMKNVYGDMGVIYHKNESNKTVLKKLIVLMERRYSAFTGNLESLINLTNIYSEYNIMETIMGTRFFVPDKECYNMLCPKYEEAIDDLIFNDDFDSIYTSFAKAYLAYEYNYYCKRMNEVFYYDTDNILEVVRELEEIKGNYWCSLELLLGQIYGDLLEKYSQAVSYYSKVIRKRKNAFACYKIGYIYKCRNKDYHSAMHYFNEALEINPMYYRALYQVGICKYNMNKMDEAKRYLEELMDILETKLDCDVLRPMEVEYLFKTYIILANMEYKKYGDIYHSFFRYTQAELLWERIRKDLGGNLIRVSHCDSKLLKKQFRQWIKKANISEIRSQKLWLSENDDNMNGMLGYDE